MSFLPSRRWRRPSCCCSRRCPASYCPCCCCSAASRRPRCRRPATRRRPSPRSPARRSSWRSWRWRWRGRGRSGALARERADALQHVPHRRDRLGRVHGLARVRVYSAEAPHEVRHGHVRERSRQRRKLRHLRKKRRQTEPHRNTSRVSRVAHEVLLRHTKGRLGARLQSPSSAD